MMRKDLHARLSAQRAQAIMECLDALAEGQDTQDTQDTDVHWYMQVERAGEWTVYVVRAGMRYRAVLEDETMALSKPLAERLGGL